MNILDISYGVVWCPGPDCISSCRNSSELNRTWKTELLPVLCETARVVPILKPRKLWWWLLKGHTWGNYLNCFEQFLSGSKIQILSDAAATFLVGAGSWWWTTATEEHKMMDQGSLYLRTFNRVATFKDESGHNTFNTTAIGQRQRERTHSLSCNDPHGFHRAMVRSNRPFEQTKGSDDCGFKRKRKNGYERHRRVGLKIIPLTW